MTPASHWRRWSAQLSSSRRTFPCLPCLSFVWRGGRPGREQGVATADLNCAFPEVFGDHRAVTRRLGGRCHWEMVTARHRFPGNGFSLGPALSLSPSLDLSVLFSPVRPRFFFFFSFVVFHSTWWSQFVKLTAPHRQPVKWEMPCRRWQNNGEQEWIEMEMVKQRYSLI